MCGRFAFFAPAEAIAAAFSLEDVPNLAPRFNIAPSQDILTVRCESGVRQTACFRWGLVPFWAKDPGIGHRMINARAETAADKPSFRQALRQRRCIIPASGFYEWQKTASGNKQPWFISARDESLLAFAGLWEAWQEPDGATLHTCTILTTAANEFMQPLHHRMPVLLVSSAWGAWLGPDTAANDVQTLLARPALPELQAWKVSTAVNSPANDSPQLVNEQESG